VPPNIVLVVMDTSRADAFEPWGAATGTTPTVAQMAGQGGASHVRSTANWTVPGHGSMFSGEMPRSLGLGQVRGDSMSCAGQIAAVRDRWLPEVLRDNGYATAAVSANLWISAQSGFDAGFDDFEHVDSDRLTMMADPGLRARLGWARQGMRARSDDGAQAAEACLARWIDHGPQQPFFWFVNLTECHSPYLPPRPFNDLSWWQRLRVADEARTHLTLEAIWKTSLGVQQMPESALQRMRHLYRASVAAMDAWMGRLLERLEHAALLSDTIVIVTSDHGENLGECGLIGHCFSLDDRLLHVPFVTSWADFPDLASLADLPRALAETIGLIDHPWAPSAFPPGVAVAQMEALAARGASQGVIELWGLDERAVTRMTTSSTCAVEGRLKLVRRDDGHQELFRLDLDPLEATPLEAPAVDQDSLARLRSAIELADQHISAAVHAAAEQGSDEGEAERIARKMRELGYL
jgi:arylsulfatase A-like enzyme